MLLLAFFLSTVVLAATVFFLDHWLVGGLFLLFGLALWGASEFDGWDHFHPAGTDRPAATDPLPTTECHDGLTSARRSDRSRSDLSLSWTWTRTPCGEDTP